MFCGIIAWGGQGTEPAPLYVTYICIYLGLPKCVKWLLRGVKLPFLRVLLAPLGRCWYMILSNFRGVYEILSTIVVSFGTSVHLTSSTTNMSIYVNIYNYNSHFRSRGPLFIRPKIHCYGVGVSVTVSPKVKFTIFFFMSWGSCLASKKKARPTTHFLSFCRHRPKPTFF